MDTRLRIAVVGVGAFGELHTKTVMGLGDARLTAIVDQDQARADRVAAALGVAATFASPAAMFAAGVADAVIIATRSDSHVPLACEALRHGLHVLVEKPAGRTLEELRLLAERQSASSRVVMVDHICLFHSLVGPLLARIGRQGLRSVHFVRHRPATTGIRFPEETPLTLLMVHDFYVAARMMNGDEPVHFEITQSRGKSGQVDMTWVLLRWHDGRVATFHSHWTLPPGAPSDGMDSIEVFGTDYHSLAQTNPAPWHWTTERTEWPIALEISEVEGIPRGMLAEVQRAFVRATRSGAVPIGCRVDDAAQVQRWTNELLQRTPLPQP